MKRKNSLTGRLSEKITEYLDDRVLDYKEQVADDLAKGLGALAGLVAIWTMITILLIFGGIALSLFIGTTLGNSLAGYGIVAGIYIVVAYIILKNKKAWIEQPVFRITFKALTSNNSEAEQKSEDEKLLEETVARIEQEKLKANEE